jgi:HK97 family phage major capsid protein
MPGQPDMLLGHPVIECEQMPDIATDSLSIAFGNFKKGLHDHPALGVRFLLDPYTAKPYIKLYTFTASGVR